MRVPFAVAVLVLSSAALLAPPASAWLDPYVRVAYGASQLKMSEVNANIDRVEASIQEAGYPASFRPVPVSYGPHASAGLWLFPGLRVGATYTYQRSYGVNRVHVPGSFFYEDDLDFRMRELGIEAAIRVPGLPGFMVGGEVARADAKMIEGVGADDAGGPFALDVTATGGGTTYNAYVGFEQTNSAHVAGFIRLGYRVRDMGRLPATGTTWDGVNTTPVSTQTAQLDYSGVYITMGMGFDLVR